MNIGIDARSLSKRMTGIGVYVREMLRIFAKLDTTDNFYLYSNHKIKVDIENGGNFHYMDKAGGGLVNKIGTLYISLGLKKQILADNIDIFWGPEHCVPICDEVKKVVTIHDMVSIKYPHLCAAYNGVVQKAIMKKSCNSADRIIAISNSTRNDIVELFSIPEERVEVIYNGDSPYKGNVCSYSRSEGDTLSEKYKNFGEYLLFVGTIEPRKNIDSIVKAFEIYRETHKKRLNLVLVGGRGWKNKKTFSYINNSKFKSNIHLAGYVDEKEKEWLYRNAKALIFPSLYEGLGLPVIEAMSVGIPVITARNSSLSEVGGDAVFYVDDALDTMGLSDHINTVVSLDGLEREKVSYKSRLQAGKFSRMECAKSTLELLLNTR